MLPEQIRALTTKIAAGAETAGELAAFLEALRAMDKPAFDEAFQYLEDESALYPAEALSIDFKSRLESRLDELDQSDRLDAVGSDRLGSNRLSRILRLRKPIYRMIWLRAASAAAVILVLSFGTYFILKPKEKPQTETAKTENKPPDIAPASNKAVLILSTGQKIVLDSAKNGQLAKIGNTTISKTDSGKLLYASNGSKAANENSFNTLTTPRGGIYELVLPDGTHAWLNAVSRIDYPTRFTGKRREVRISGEVYFEVAHDRAHPFVVSFANTQVEVLGTHFNIKSYDTLKVRTTLLEGSIKISTHNQNKIIKPGEQAITGTSGNSIELRRDADPDDVMAWRNGEMALSSGSVKEVMNEISRWYDMDIEYAGATPNKQFYGSVRRDVPLSTVLHALEAYGVQTKVEGKKIIVQ